MFVSNYRLQKPLFDECLKSLVSEDPSKSSMVKKRKDCRKLNHSTFSIFLDHCGDN